MADMNVYSDADIYGPVERAQAFQAKQNALAAQRQQDMQAQMMRNVLAQSIDPNTGQTNWRNAFVSAPQQLFPQIQQLQQADLLAQATLGKKRADITLQEAKTGRERKKTEAEDLGLTVTRMRTLNGLIGAAVDERSYQENLRTAQQMGFDVSEAPPNFDANWVANARQAALTAQQQAELELKQQNAASLQNYRDQQLGLSRQRVGLQRQRLSAAQGETGLPKEERAAMAKFNVDVMYRGVRDAATRSRKTLPAIDTALSILDKGFDTGFGTEAKTQAARVLSALGISEAGKYAADAAVFQSTVAQTVLDRQLEQKGPQTEADAARITQTSAQLKTPKEANRFILNVAKVQAKRDIAQQKFYDDYWNKNGTLKGVEDAWYSGEGGKSLFEDPLLSKSTRAPAAGKPAASAGDVDYSNPLLGGRP